MRRRGGKTVKKAAAFLVDKRRIFLCLFLVLAAACLLLAGKVHINYDLAEYLPADSDMKQGPGDDQRIKEFTLCEQSGNIKSQSDKIEYLAQMYKRLFTGDRIDHDRNDHDQCHIERTRDMDAVKEERSHHQEGIHPQSVMRIEDIPDMHEPGSYQSRKDQHHGPFLPAHDEGFTYQYKTKAGIYNQYDQMRLLIYLVLLEIISHRIKPLSFGNSYLRLIY